VFLGCARTTLISSTHIMVQSDHFGPDALLLSQVVLALDRVQGSVQAGATVSNECSGAQRARIVDTCITLNDSWRPIDDGKGNMIDGPTMGGCDVDAHYT
jgi:hypothetical protein